MKFTKKVYKRRGPPPKTNWVGMLMAAVIEVTAVVDKAIMGGETRLNQRP